MLDPLDSLEIATASRNRGGRSGPSAGILIQLKTFVFASRSSTPRAAYSRGVCVFGRAVFFRANLQAARSQNNFRARQSGECVFTAGLPAIPRDPSAFCRMPHRSSDLKGGFHV